MLKFLIHVVVTVHLTVNLMGKTDYFDIRRSLMIEACIALGVFLLFGGAVQWEVLKLRNTLLLYHVFVTLPRRVLLPGAAEGNFVVAGNRNIITI